MPPVTKYVQSGDVGIAYQVMGDRPLDLLIVPSAISQNLDKSAGSRLHLGNPARDGSKIRMRKNGQ
jgi:hypothetical protein